MLVTQYKSTEDKLLNMGNLLSEYPTSVLVPAQPKNEEESKGINFDNITEIIVVVTKAIKSSRDVFFPNGKKKKLRWFNFGRIAALIGIVIELYNDVSDIVDPGSPNLDND